MQCVYRWYRFKEKLMAVKSDRSTSPTETATETEATTEVNDITHVFDFQPF